MAWERDTGIAPHGAKGPSAGDGGEARCPVCKSASTIPVDSQPLDYEYFISPSRPFRVRHCTQCGSNFVYPRPTVAELVSFYPLDYHAYNEDHGSIAQPLVDLRARLRARFYREKIPRPTVRLFDVGCGDCRHFEALRRFGDFEFAGVEIKPEMVAAARARGFEVAEGTLEDLDISKLAGSFDVVTMYQLVEHVLDPLELLVKARALLRPGGIVVGQLPCVDCLERRAFGRYWAGYHYPRHLQMISRKGMTELLTASGFGEVAVNRSLHLQAAISLQNCLVDKLDCKSRMKFGKTPFYSFLLLSAAPFAMLEYVLGLTGMMNFSATKGAARTAAA